MSVGYKRGIVIFGLFVQYKRISSWTGSFPEDINYND
jgi:hypothetical protein